MTEMQQKVIEPRTHFAPGVSRTPSGPIGLPDDLLTENVKRIGICSAVGAGLWTYGLVMDTIVSPLAVGAAVLPMWVAVEVVAIVTSLLMVAYVRYAGHVAQTKTTVGLVYLVVNAIFVSLLNVFVRGVTMELGHLSWNVVVILVGSMIIVASPMRMLATAFAAASMDPIAVGVAHLLGLPVPSAANTAVLFMPNYACAAVTILPSHILNRLGRRLRHAREMGSYHLLELLGRGGMGEVWRGYHRLLARGAAIKLIRPELLGATSEAAATSMLRRFEREAQATAALGSPHTIQVFDFGVTADQTFYYVMELLQGRDLESLVREFGPVPADRVVFLLRQVCHSLADAHARGLVHRDVTPANVYVCRMGLEYDFVKVLDFGLVKFDDSHSMQSTLMTGAHMTTGTPAFMAPEIILDEHSVDQRADVYSLGCVAYFLLTGQLVFEADTAMKMFVHHLRSVPIPPSQRSEMPIPRELDELVLACLEKDPRKRPQDAAQVLQMLRDCRSRWDSEAARNWWETHLLELTGPLAPVDVTATESMVTVQ